jgi:hypothetical protein
MVPRAEGVATLRARWIMLDLEWRPVEGSQSAHWLRRRRTIKP